jgi:hypothetical protein
MSTISIVIVVAGLAATVFFLAGFLRGAKQAIADRDVPANTETAGNAGHLGTAIFAVVASAFVITAVGWFPAAIYIGPLLAIGTAFAVGLAFFIDR